MTVRECEGEVLRLGALVATQIRSVGLGHACVLIGLGLMTAFSSAFAQSERISFNIPAQPLASALFQFAETTGMTALIDGQLAQGLKSSPVKGRLSPQDALRILLAGTALSIRYAGTNAFTLTPTMSEQSRDGAVARNARHPDHGDYFSQVQSVLERTLCRNGGLGSYRAAFQIWVGEGGSVQALHFLSSTGDETRDTTIAAALRSASIAPPPRDLPQPLTIILRPKASAPDCTKLSGLRP